MACDAGKALMIAFRIENFISRADATHALGPVTFLVGANGSNTLEALRLLAMRDRRP